MRPCWADETTKRRQRQAREGKVYVWKSERKDASRRTETAQ